jgi:uncharacterized protein YktA (UPF0223 family)
MLIIQHRVNTIELLQQVNTDYGIEFDVRDKYNDIIVTHDAFVDGVPWVDFLDHYRHQHMIVNVKTEGIEKKIIEDLEKKNIDNYFLLDVSLPFLVKLSNDGFRKMAVRFSDYEPLEFTMKFAGKVDWVWVDCFHGLPLNESNYALLSQHFKICIVSPELHGKPVEEIAIFQQTLHNMKVQAVCTKQPLHWLHNNI